MSSNIEILRLLNSSGPILTVALMAVLLWAYIYIHANWKSADGSTTEPIWLDALIVFVLVAVNALQFVRHKSLVIPEDSDDELTDEGDDNNEDKKKKDNKKKNDNNKEKGKTEEAKEKKEEQKNENKEEERKKAGTEASSGSHMICHCKMHPISRSSVLNTHPIPVYRTLPVTELEWSPWYLQTNVIYWLKRRIMEGWYAGCRMFRQEYLEFYSFVTKTLVSSAVFTQLLTDNDQRIRMKAGIQPYERPFLEYSCSCCEESCSSESDTSDSE